MLEGWVTFEWEATKMQVTNCFPIWKLGKAGYLPLCVLCPNLDQDSPNVFLIQVRMAIHLYVVISVLVPTLWSMVLHRNQKQNPNWDSIHCYSFMRVHFCSTQQHPLVHIVLSWLPFLSSPTVIPQDQYSYLSQIKKGISFSSFSSIAAPASKYWGLPFGHCF